MTINIYPEDILKRCLWDTYVYYVIGGSDKEAERILKENREITMSEQDALVIGLLKVIETDNLIFKFNTYVAELLSNRSSKVNEYLLIIKKTFVNIMIVISLSKSNSIGSNCEFLRYVNFLQILFYQNKSSCARRDLNP